MLELEVDAEEFECLLSGNQKCLVLPNNEFNLDDFDLEEDYIKVIDKDSFSNRSLQCSISHFFELMECYVASIDIIDSENV